MIVYKHKILRQERRNGNGLRMRVARCRQSGMTLIEVTVYISMALALSAALLMMLSSHFTFMRVLTTMEFLRDDAPQINVMLTGIFGKADSYRIYGNRGDAAVNDDAVNADGTAVRLQFRNPNGTVTYGILAFEDIGAGLQLNFYSSNSVVWPADPTWPPAPSWTVSHQAANVTFADDTGILLVTLTGPNDEQITYGGTGE